MQLLVGCAMWANRDWLGRFFPAETPKGRELSAYSTWCNAVEGNTTFYGLPAPATVDRWAADAPDSFRFMFKLPRTITHDKRLRDVNAELVETLDRLEPLGERAAPLSVQLPPSFGPNDLYALDRFLSLVPVEWRCAVEVRHGSFSDGGPGGPALHQLLSTHGADRIIIDTRAVFAGPRQTDAEIEAFERKPRLPVRPVAVGEHPVVRFIGQTDPEANPAWWAKWVPKVAEWIGEGRTPIVFIHTPDNLVAPELARRFHAQVRTLVPELAPLPEPVSASDQLNLL